MLKLCESCEKSLKSYDERCLNLVTCLLEHGSLVIKYGAYKNYAQMFDDEILNHIEKHGYVISNELENGCMGIILNSKCIAQDCVCAQCSKGDILK